jgi:hypothetical protein
VLDEDEPRVRIGGLGAGIGAGVAVGAIVVAAGDRGRDDPLAQRRGVVAARLVWSSQRDALGMDQVVEARRAYRHELPRPGLRT